MAVSSPIVVIFALALVTVTSALCYDHCKFKLCYSQVVHLGDSDTDITGPICRKRNGAKIGVANSGEAKVVISRGKGRYSLQRISKYKPKSLKQRFARSFFKTFSYRYYTRKDRYTYLAAIGHEVPQQNQLRYIRNECIVLPIKNYQKLDRKYNFKGNVNKAKRSSCVAFITK